MPDLLNDRDALAPVLAGLSEEEWTRLCESIDEELPFKDDETDYEERYRLIKRTLTLPTADLARAIAEAIRK